MKKPDRPKNPSMRLWKVAFDDGAEVEVEAEYRGAARHYAKSLIDGCRSSRAHYIKVKSVRLVRTEA